LRIDVKIDPDLYKLVTADADRIGIPLSGYLVRLATHEA
jgi:hypothetical protein